MMLNSIYSADMVKALENRKLQPQRQEEEPAVPNHKTPMREDKVSLGENSSDIVTYGIPENAARIDSDFNSLKEMLVGILEEQGILTQIGSGDNAIDFRDITPEKAQELISDEGYLGVEQTSDRIVQFAISISGNDPDRLEEVKASIDKGFQMASNALGGTLPDISSKTYQAIMEKLDAWAEAPDQSAPV